MRPLGWWWRVCQAGKHRKLITWISHTWSISFWRQLRNIKQCEDIFCKYTRSACGWPDAKLRNVDPWETRSWKLHCKVFINSWLFTWWTFYLSPNPQHAQVGVCIPVCICVYLCVYLCTSHSLYVPILAFHIVWESVSHSQLHTGLAHSASHLTARASNLQTALPQSSLGVWVLGVQTQVPTLDTWSANVLPTKSSP